jgi:hypothetical protein
VAIRIEHGEEVGRGPDSQDLLALLGALVVSTRLTIWPLIDKRIGSDCKSLVDSVHKYRHTRMRNEVGKLLFLLAIQQYLQRDKEQQVRWLRLHPEKRKTDKMDFDQDEWGYT